LVIGGRMTGVDGIEFGPKVRSQAPDNISCRRAGAIATGRHANPAPYATPMRPGAGAPADLTVGAKPRTPPAILQTGRSSRLFLEYY
ncbi:MAG: hypothetical protein LUO93_05340, partial [Methanomicrobiales archaeon]|nr:hypothetical protein [Methanomicrobiales archaeon]